MDLVKTSGLENDLMQSGQNVTVFVPSNDAIDDFRHDMEEVNFYMSRKIRIYLLFQFCII